MNLKLSIKTEAVKHDMKRKTFGDYARTGALYAGITLGSIASVLGLTGCPGPVPTPGNYIEEENEGVDKVKQVLADNGLSVEYYDKEIRIYDPVKGKEVIFYPDLGNESEGIYAEFNSDEDGFTDKQIETIQNILNGPGYPAVITAKKGYEEDIEDEVNNQLDDWGL